MKNMDVDFEILSDQEGTGLNGGDGGDVCGSWVRGRMGDDVRGRSYVVAVGGD